MRNQLQTHSFFCFIWSKDIYSHMYIYCLRTQSKNELSQLPFQVKSNSKFLWSNKVLRHTHLQNVSYICMLISLFFSHSSSSFSFNLHPESLPLSLFLLDFDTPNVRIDAMYTFTSQYTQFFAFRLYMCDDDSDTSNVVVDDHVQLIVRFLIVLRYMTTITVALRSS
jgi:hypothetical protein